MDTPCQSDSDDLVFVVDDDVSVREAVRRLLESEGLAVRAFASAEDFLAAEQRSRASSCLVLDVSMPGLDGLELQRQLRTREDPPAIVFLTGRGDIPMSVQAIKDGAAEFFTKPFRPADLSRGVRDALSRQRRRRDERQKLNALRKRLQSLTPRERSVLQGVLEGLANKQIAGRFGTSEVTVKEQRAQVMRKMAATSAAELVRMGLWLGLVSFED